MNYYEILENLTYFEVFIQIIIICSFEVIKNLTYIVIISNLTYSEISIQIKIISFFEVFKN